MNADSHRFDLRFSAFIRVPFRPGPYDAVQGYLLCR